MFSHWYLMTQQCIWLDICIRSCLMLPLVYLCLSTSPNIIHSGNRQWGRRVFRKSCWYRKRFKPYLSTFVELEHETVFFFSDTRSFIKGDGKELTVLTLNIQSINAKFDHLYPGINNLPSMVCILGPLVFSKHSFHLMPICLYDISPAIN